MKRRQTSRLESSYRTNDKNSDSEEENELFTINKSLKKEKPTVDKVVEEGDTLQSLAIRYSCTIEDLKRLNNIHKENEIFAKRTIKVPLYQFSDLAGVHISGRSSPMHPSTSQKLDEDLLVTNLHENEVNQIIFNSNITQKIVTVEHESDETDDEEVHLLPQIPTTDSPLATNKLNCSGVDGGMSLKALILCILILIFMVPLIYVFYIAEHPEQYHHQSQHHTTTKPS